MGMLPMATERDMKLPPKVDLLNRGYKKVREVCTEKWPRLMPVTWAAAYCGFNLPRFRSVPELAGLVRDIGGAQMVDRHELDAVIDSLVFGASVVGGDGGEERRTERTRENQEKED